MGNRPVGLVLRSREGTSAGGIVSHVMQEFLAQKGIRYELAEPSNLDASRYRLLVHSPATTLEPAGIVPGPHVVNVAGIPEGLQNEDFAGYAYVSVRSLADRRRIGETTAAVAVAPLIATRLARIATRRPRRDAVGIHFDRAAFAAAPGWHEPLRELRGLGKEFLPLDPEDRAPLAHLMRAVGEGRSAGSPPLTELVERVGTLRLLVCCSLDAAILACLQNVPFLLYPSDPDAADYLEDRGLDPWIFRTPDELGRKARMLLEAAPDYTAVAERDVFLADRHFEVLERALTEPGPVSVPAELSQPSFGRPTFRFDGAPLEPAKTTAPGAEERTRAFVSRLGLELDRLHAEIASQCDRIAELAAEVDRLQIEVVAELQHEMRRREDLIQEMRGSRAWRFASQLQELHARLRGGLGKLRGKTPS